MASKSTKKVTASKSTSRKASVQSKSVSSSAPSKEMVRRRKIIGAVVLVLIGLGILAYIFKGLFIAATVNGQPITRMALTSELEKKSGKATLDALVTKDLILQEMKKKNITVSDAEVNAEMKKIEDALAKQGRTLDSALQQQGLTKADLVDQLRIQKMIEKLFAKNVIVTDAEITAYISQNKDSFPEGQDEKTIRTGVEQQLKQQKLTTKFQEWLSGLQKAAKIQYFVTF